VAAWLPASATAEISPHARICSPPRAPTTTIPSPAPAPLPSFRPCLLQALDSLGLPKFFESDRVQIEGLVVQDYSAHYSHWNAASSLSAWLAESDVPGIAGVDTRLLTKRIRDKGALLGKIIYDGGSPIATGPFHDPNKRNLVAEVSRATPRVFGAGGKIKVLAVDCGIKYNMIRMLVERGCEVKVVPWDWDIAAERAWYDALFISNGPGDPAKCTCVVWVGATVASLQGARAERGRGRAWGLKELRWRRQPRRRPSALCVRPHAWLRTRRRGLLSMLSSLPLLWRRRPLISQLRTAIASPDGIDKPIFGICLGNQLTGLAAGAESYKLPFGNRGQNQPVINLITKHAFITPQNHGFAIDTTRLPPDWQPLFVNANDGTNEGIMHKSKPIFTAQFHPEANGGPNDTAFLFDMFVETIKSKSSAPVQTLVRKTQPPKPEVQKVLVLGS
jgi:carbamoylphosphate synthase small subunit